MTISKVPPGTRSRRHRSRVVHLETSMGTAPHRHRLVESLDLEPEFLCALENGNATSGSFHPPAPDLVRDEGIRIELSRRPA